MWVINLDTRQGCHQVAVRPVDQEKLAFFAPENHKYCWVVIPFSPTNAPPFYSAMMSDLKDKWDKLFLIKVKSLNYIDSEPITVTDLLEIWLVGISITHGIRAIIDNILLFCSNLTIIFLYLEYICIIFRKYRVSFRLDKCEFLKDKPNMSAMTSPQEETAPPNLNLI